MSWRCRFSRQPCSRRGCAIRRPPCTAGERAYPPAGRFGTCVPTRLAVDLGTDADAVIEAPGRRARRALPSEPPRLSSGRFSVARSDPDRPYDAASRAGPRRQHSSRCTADRHEHSQIFPPWLLNWLAKALPRSWCASRSCRHRCWPASRAKVCPQARRVTATRTARLAHRGQAPLRCSSRDNTPDVEDALTWQRAKALRRISTSAHCMLLVTTRRPPTALQIQSPALGGIDITTAIGMRERKALA